MLQNTNIDIDVVAVIGAFLCGIIWMVRLEAKVLYLEKSNENHWEKLDDMQSKLEQISESLARLEGQFKQK